MWGEWGEQGKTYEHDVLDIAEGHSSWLIRIVFGMDMILFQLVYNMARDGNITVSDYQASNATSDWNQIRTG